MARIFISYRRSDTGYVARMLADRLQHQYGSGSVFLDVDNIPPGVDFRNHLDAAVAQCDVFLALIGTEWLSASESGVSRLEDARDFVRIELESALRRSIPVIPILTESAAMPREDQLPESLRAFAYRNGMELRAGADLEAHLARI
ncbi:MAG: toll/interleukin-1 receptor domain-containing protein, partial [Planctomyces sp.]